MGQYSHRTQQRLHRSESDYAVRNAIGRGRCMTDEVSETIECLRDVMNATSDADLARKLQIGQSTVSTWRKRGPVPMRYQRIAKGEHPFAYGEAPAYWSANENAALGIALTRYCRINFDAVTENDFASLLEMANYAEDLWTLLRAAREDLATSAGKSLHARVAELLHRDCTNPTEAAQRDRKLIEEGRPAVSTDGKTWAQHLACGLRGSAHGPT